MAGVCQSPQLLIAENKFSPHLTVGITYEVILLKSAASEEGNGSSARHHALTAAVV